MARHHTHTDNCYDRYLPPFSLSLHSGLAAVTPEAFSGAILPRLLSINFTAVL